MLGCLQLSGFAEESGQVNEIKDTQRRFFHFLPSSQGGFEERCPTVGLELWSLRSFRCGKKPLDSIMIYNCNEQCPVRSPISWE